MVKSIFYFPYNGNKYNEYEYIKDYINLENITTYVEPFSGSFSLGYLIKKNNPKLIVHYNDINTLLCNFLSCMKDKTSEELQQFISEYNELKSSIKNVDDWNSNILPNIKTDVLKYYFFMKCRTRGSMPRVVNKILINANHTLNIDYNNFIKSVSKITNLDYIKVLEEYKDDSQAFIFLDPPYLGSTSVYDFSTEYSGMKKFNDARGTTFEEMANHPLVKIKKYFDTSKCKIMMVVDCSLTNYYMFEKYVKHRYSKKYEKSKKLVEHIIICNY